tara:strand:- start:113 stop:367 length:255 start_codon:yes stop_codon:yes gene_type:complete
MRLFTATALTLAVFSTSAIADQTTGTIVAYDRLANVIVFKDKSVWALDAKTLVPSDLQAGDAVTLTFTSDGDNGAKPASELHRD